MTLTDDGADAGDTKIVIENGADFTFGVSVDAEGGASTAVSWLSDTPTVATVDESGKVTIVELGTTKITATSDFDDTKFDSIDVTVEKAPAVNSVTLTEGDADAGDTKTVIEKDAFTLGVSVDAEGGASMAVAWSSATPAVATVDESGKVTIVGGGTATITATSDFDDTKSDSISLTAIGLPPAGEYYKLASNKSKLATQGAAWSATGTEAAGTKWTCALDSGGLLWEVKTEDGGDQDKERVYNLGEAYAFVVSVNAAGLCGYSDWRLPTIVELRTLLRTADSTPAVTSAPYINKDIFPNTKSNWYDSGSLAGANTEVYAINFSDATEDLWPIDRLTGHVRLVRGGQ